MFDLHKRSPVVSLLSIVFSVLACANAFSQSADTMLLKGKAVTEENVLDALTPAPTGRVATRSLRVTAEASPSATALAPAKKPSASLLITFQTNSATLTAHSREQLDVVAAALKNDRLKDFTFDVEGHADARGRADVNRALSQQRAESVRNYLVATHGISDTRLRAVGKGDSEPLNTQDVAAAENRRVTIVTNAR